LVGADLKGGLLHTRPAEFNTLKDRLTGRDLRFVELEEDFAANHHASDFGRGGLAGDECAGDMTISQDGDGVGYFEHFFELVADEDGGFAVALEFADDAE